MSWPLVHVLVPIGTVLVLELVHRRGAREAAQSRPAMAAVGATVLLPLLVHLVGLDAGWWLGKEALSEDVTHGALLWLAARAGLGGAPLLAAAAALFFLEEVNYFQEVLGFATPEVIRQHEEGFNLHNLPVIGLAWRALPIAAVLIASRRWGLREDGRRILGLPVLHPATAVAVVVCMTLVFPVGAVVGEWVADEAWEVTLVLAVALGWVPTPRGEAVAALSDTEDVEEDPEATPLAA